MNDRVSKGEIEKWLNRIKKELETAGPLSKRKILRRLKFLQGMLQAGIRPEWMLLSVLPVLPPDLRPMVQLEGGRYASSDLNDLYRSEDARKVVDICLNRGANLSLIFSPRHRDPDGFDVHQIRCAFYSMLDCNDDAYLAARAIQFFTPGIPQVYYVGLLAGKNDQSAVARTGDGRDINRHNYSIDEVEREFQRPVVQRLIKLIRFRNEYDAFDGVFQVQDSDDWLLKLSWENKQKRCQLIVDLSSYKALIHYTNDAGNLVDYPL